MVQSQKRQVAYKVRINDILNGQYVKEEGEWVPNYIQIRDKKVSRINLIAVIVSKQEEENNNQQNLLIDDGSGRISIRSFEGGEGFSEINVGDFVMVIGRPREYFNEKYIVSEILKKVDNPLWVEVRKLELGDKGEIKEQTEVTKSEVVNDGRASEEEVNRIKDSKNPSGITVDLGEDDINKKIFDLIKGIDSGGGADTQEVITKLNTDDGEQIITRLLEQGEVFEIKPGKLKILE